MKAALRMVWNVVSMICILAVVVLIVAGIVLNSRGALTGPKIDAVVRVAKGEQVFEEPPTGSELGQKMIELEGLQSMWEQQRARTEQNLVNLAALSARELKGLREREEALYQREQDFKAAKDAWDAVRGPQTQTEQVAARRRVFKSMIDMSPTEQVEILVTYGDKELAEMMKLYKGEAAGIWPALRAHTQMKAQQPDGRSRFEVFWEIYNKPDPLPTNQ